MSGKSGLGYMKAATAAEVCHNFALDDAAAPLLKGDPAPREFLQRLSDKQYYPDGIRFLAHALPAREAVWWGGLCLWRAVESRGDRLPPPQQEALRAAMVWVLEPGEENRRTAEKAGRAATLSNAAGCLAMAVFWSSGSMTAAHLPPVASPPFAAAKCAAGAVLLAAVLNGGRKSPGYQQRFVELGEQVADGNFLWNDPANLL
jgi:uncharacterized protein DUF6931